MTLGLLIVMLVAIAPGAEALEQTFGYRQFGTAQLDGFKGRQGIRTDPATVTGIGYVHPTQMDIGSVGAAFVAIGTAKGVGVDDCANDYDALWTVYIDGEIGGTYFCEDVDVDAYGSGTNPAFNISYEFCPSVLANRWLLSFGGVLWSCKSAGATGATRAIGMIETTGSSSTDRNIDVKYTNLQLNNISSNTWNNFGNAASSVAPNYSFANVSTTAFNVFLAPLD